MTAYGRLLIVAWMLAAGCDRTSPPTTALPAPTFGDATVCGTVRFVGTPPPLPMIDTGGTCRGAAPIQAETMVVDRNGGLRDVVVWLADAPASDGAGQPPPTLDQVGCRYEPHVIGLQVNQPLRLRSSDPEYHNVHWTDGANPGDNIGFPSAGTTSVVRFRAAEFVRTTCGVHPWMEAYIAVTPNPFFATTARDGTFRIPRVPAGTYAVKAWHPVLLWRDGTVTVAAGGTATLDLTYERPKP